MLYKHAADMSPKTVLVLLVTAAFIVGVSARTLTEADLTSQRTEGRELSSETMEHQRILAELEEVHQLRERMLQEGKPWTVS